MATSSLRNRIASLERQVAMQKRGSFADRLNAARKRCRAMTADEIAQRRQQRFERVASTPPPPEGTLARRLWDVARRWLREQPDGA